VKRSFAAFGIFVAVLIGAGVYLMPATWLDSALQRESRGVLSLGDPQGRVWEGSGVLQALLPGGEAMTVDRVGWTVAWRELFSGRIRFSLISVRTGKSIADAALGVSGLTVHSGQLELPASLLGTLTPTLRELALSGQLVLKFRDFHLADKQAGGTVEVTWNDAASGLVPISPLGNYQIEIKGNDSGLGCRIATLNEAALKLTGKCQHSAGQPFSLDATAEPAPRYRRELAPLLRVIGKEIRPGIYQLQIDPSIGVDSGTRPAKLGSPR
jgi:general secretion pathway protein N